MSVTMGYSGERRAKRIRITAAVVEQMSRIGPGLRIVRALRSFVLTRGVYAGLLRYRRPFASLTEAEEAIASFERNGHEGAANIEFHVGMHEDVRPSDYAAMFHLRPLLPGIARVFDLGGSVGNLFYGYHRYLAMPAGVTWQVFDLPAVLDRGRDVAQQRGAIQLAFTSAWEDASGADVLVAAGSLHYFEKPLWAMVDELPSRPGYVLINRTPLTDGGQVATVQDAVGVRVACVMYNKGEMIQGFEQVGYELVDEWRAPELSLRIPGYPEHSAPWYTGLFFRLKTAG